MKSILTAGLLFISIFTSGQTTSSFIGKIEKAQVIDSVSLLLSNYYIFPEKIPSTISYLKGNFKKGVYDRYNNANAFANKLTEDIVSVLKDKHFHVYYDPESIAEERKAVSSKDSSLMIQNEIADGIAHNFGFKEVRLCKYRWV